MGEGGATRNRAAFRPTPALSPPNGAERVKNAALRS